MGPQAPADETTGLHGWWNTVRQRYADLERDASTGLEHATFRKYEPWAGRWTSPDPYLGSMNPVDPQSFNRYAYVQNDPVNFVDPSGLNLAGPNTRYADLIGLSARFGPDLDFVAKERKVDKAQWQAVQDLCADGLAVDRAIITARGPVAGERDIRGKEYHHADAHDCDEEYPQPGPMFPKCAEHI